MMATQNGIMVPTNLLHWIWSRPIETCMLAHEAS